MLLLAAVAGAVILWMPAQDPARADGKDRPVPIVQLRTVVKAADALGSSRASDAVDAIVGDGDGSVAAEAPAEREHRVAEPLLLVAGALVLGIALTVRERRQRRGYT
jgi:hypothetical protein